MDKVINKKNMKKCKIYNDQFSWVMEVDSQKILFNGGDNAEYFKNLFSDLGYDVSIDYDYYKSIKL